MTDLVPDGINDLTFSGVLILLIVVSVTWLIREWWPFWKDVSKTREERNHDYAKSINELNVKLTMALQKMEFFAMKEEQSATDRALLLERQRELLDTMRSLYELSLNNSHNILSNYGRIELKLRDVINIIGNRREER